MKIEDAIQQKKFHSVYQKMIINISYTSSFINQIVSAFLKEKGLSVPQFNVLRILKGQFPNPASVNLIGDRMIDKMSNASRLVEKLRQKELLERKTCNQDRRQVDVIISKKGLAILEEIDQELPKLEMKFQTLNSSEIETLNFLLDKLRSNE